MALLPYSSGYQAPYNDNTNEQKEIIVNARICPLKHEDSSVTFKGCSFFLNTVQTFILHNSATVEHHIKNHQPTSLKKQSWKKEFLQSAVHSHAMAFYEQAQRQLKMKGNLKTIDELFMKALKLFNESRAMCVAEKEMFAENLFYSGNILCRFKYYLNALIYIEVAAQLCPDNSKYTHVKQEVQWLMYNMKTKKTIEWIDKALESEEVAHFKKADLMLCKMEAHALQGEENKWLETAFKTLEIMDTDHPWHDMVLRMTKGELKFA